MAAPNGPCEHRHHVEVDWNRWFTGDRRTVEQRSGDPSVERSAKVSSGYDSPRRRRAARVPGYLLCSVPQREAEGWQPGARCARCAAAELERGHLGESRKEAASWGDAAGWDASA